MESLISTYPQIQVLVVAPFEPARVGLSESLSRPPDLGVVGDCAGLTELAQHRELQRADVLLVDAAVLASSAPDAGATLNGIRGDLKVLFLGSALEAAALSTESLEFA